MTTEGEIERLRAQLGEMERERGELNTSLRAEIEARRVAEARLADLQRVVEDAMRSRGSLASETLDALFRGIGAASGRLERINVNYHSTGTPRRRLVAELTFLDWADTPGQPALIDSERVVLVPIRAGDIGPPSRSSRQPPPSP